MTPQQIVAAFADAMTAAAEKFTQAIERDPVNWNTTCTTADVQEPREQRVTGGTVTEDYHEVNMIVDGETVGPYVPKLLLLAAKREGDRLKADLTESLKALDMANTRLAELQQPGGLSEEEQKALDHARREASGCYVSYRFSKDELSELLAIIDRLSRQQPTLPWKRVVEGNIPSGLTRNSLIIAVSAYHDISHGFADNFTFGNVVYCLDDADLLATLPKD